jgi:Fe-S cluster assembly iron-binding protein IscA
MGMVYTSNKAAERLRGELINKCFEAGIGFRVLVTDDEYGKATISIKLDRQHVRDEAIESNSIKVFSDPASASRISGYQLDYQDEPGSGFILKTIQDFEGGQNKCNGAMLKAKV